MSVGSLAEFSAPASKLDLLGVDRVGAITARSATGPEIIVKCPSAAGPLRACPLAPRYDDGALG